MKRATTIQLIILAALAMGAPALAAQKATAKPKAAQTAPPPQPGEGDLDDVAGAGKVIEIDPNGSAKVVKGDAAPVPDKLELKKGEVGAAEACRMRFKAQCSLLKRCLKTDELDCEALSAGCSQLTGKAIFGRKAVDECVAGVAALSCEAPNDQLDANPESRVPACKPILVAEQQGPAASEPAVEKRPPEKLNGSGEPDLSGYKTIEVPQDGAEEQAPAGQ